MEIKHPNVFARAWLFLGKATAENLSVKADLTVVPADDDNSRIDELEEQSCIAMRR